MSNCLRLSFAVAVLLLASASRAEEIAPFKMTGIDGHVSLQYVQDEQATDQPAAASSSASGSRQTQSGLRNEIFVMTHSYIYHPNLLALDIGGGPVLHGESYLGDGGAETRARGVQYNFSARATLLRDKPYNGALYYSHLNPTVTVAPGQVLTQENTRYGFDFSLLAAASPVPLQASFTRSHAQGRGADRLVDERIDQFNLNASSAIGALGSTQVQFQTSRQASQSGSQDLPIQSSTANSQSVSADTRLQFGAERQYDFTNLVSFNSQDYALESGYQPQLKDARFLLDLHARHSDKLQSYGFYNYGHSSQGSLDSVIQAASAGLSYWPLKELETTLGVRGDNNQTRQFAAQSHGIDGSLRYEQPLPLGTAQLSYGARVDNRGQQAAASQTGVLGERMTLAGVGYVALAHPDVIAGTPLVSNAARTQSFVAGTDYLLTVVGRETRLQRLIGGRILDGEPLVVDYVYDVGGSYALNQTDQTLGLDWSFRNINVYFRRFSAAPRLTAGLPTFPLNPVKSSTCGVRADLPFDVGMAITAGGGLEFEDRHEVVSPYRRQSADGYVQTDEPLFGVVYLRASLRRARIEYAVAAQNSDLQGHELRLWSRQWFGMDLTAAFSAEHDDAGAIPRRRSDGSLGLQWQQRKFKLTASLVRSHETQGGAARDRSTFQFLAIRDF
ncbi:MAG: hypothetical protein ACHQIO_02835 [Nevskiales bacterium]